MSATEPEAAPPSGTLTQSNATAGNTELEGQGQFAAAVEKTDEQKATELELSAGGIASTGNARAISITGLGKFRLRRRIHQFRAEVAGNYGRAAADAYSDLETNVTNVQGLLRYDVFFHKRVSAFAQIVGRHDTFQGLEFRVNVDPGFAFYALTNPKHRLWFEVGYDFQYDVRTDEARLIRDDDGNVIEDAALRDSTFTNHAIRLFGGYTNNLSEILTFDTGLEYLQSVVDGNVFRLIWGTSLSAQLASRVSLSASFNLRYENRPVVERKLDTITAVLLGVRFL